MEWKNDFLQGLQKGRFLSFFNSLTFTLLAFVGFLFTFAEN